MCDKKAVQNVLIQTKIQHAWRVSYCDRILNHLDKAKPRDIIVATEAWHDTAFRGMLSPNMGGWNGIPVVELWIDYPESFARYRVFNTHYHRSFAAGQESQQDWMELWTVARPYIEVDKTQPALDLLEVDPFDGTCLEHLYAMARGVPVVAPYWGAYVETVEHGRSGMLYKSLKGKEEAIKWARKLPSSEIKACVAEQFSLQGAVDELRPFLLRISNEGTYKITKYSESGGSDSPVGGDS